MSQFYNNINAESNDDCLVPATKEVALKLGSLMSFLVAKNDQVDSEEAAFTSFYHPSVPSISLWDYGERLIENMCVSLESYVMAATYIANLEPIVTEHTAHRIMLAAVVVASKNQDDRRPTMGYFSDIGGVEKAELVMMEEELVYLLRFRTYVDPVRYQKALLALDTARVFQEAVEEAHSFVLDYNSDDNATPMEKYTPDTKTSLPIDERNYYDDITAQETMMPQTPPTPRTWRRAGGDSNTSMASTTSTSSNFSSFGGVSSRFRAGARFLVKKRKSVGIQPSKHLNESANPKPNAVWAEA